MSKEKLISKGNNGKEIWVVYRKPNELKKEFGNPRKISFRKKEELKRSILEFGDFGITVIDENENVIAGNQRLQAYIELDKGNEYILCKKLIGYSEAELKAINVRDNTHDGEFDDEVLLEWMNDIEQELDLDLLGLDLDNIEELSIDDEENIEVDGGESLEDEKIPEMELKAFEKYDYVLFVFKNEMDWMNVIQEFDLKKVNYSVVKNKKIGFGRVVDGKKLIEKLEHKSSDSEQRAKQNNNKP